LLNSLGQLLLVELEPSLLSGGSIRRPYSLLACDRQFVARNIPLLIGGSDGVNIRFNVRRGRFFFLRRVIKLKVCAYVRELVGGKLLFEAN
jgi:hypothetical protein